MIKRLLSQISDTLSAPAPSGASSADRETAIRKATAVLMLDVAMSDKHTDEQEIERILSHIQERFSLSDEDASELVDGATEAATDMVSLHEFTEILHKNLSEQEKAGIIALLWEVAYADGRLDKHEDALILKIGDLLYVDRVRVMRAKHDAERSSQ